MKTIHVRLMDTASSAWRNARFRLLAITMTLAAAWLPAAAQEAGQASPEALQRLAARAFVWGYPLNYNVGSMAFILKGGMPEVPSAALNRFSHLRKPLTPDTKFVSPNVDVLFSLAVVDLSGGPLVLSVPDSGGRYYCLQFIDVWTNNFAYVGRRATGTKAGEYLIADAGYQGAVPKGMTLIRAPSRLFAIVGRLALDNEHDHSALHAIQDGFGLRQLQPGTQPLPDVAEVFPQADPRAPANLRFWENLRVGMAAFPPSSAEREWMQQFAPLGLLEKTSPYVQASPELTALLLAGQQTGTAQIEEAIKGAYKTVNGWSSLLHLYDYNLDHFEIGIRNEPAWKITDRNTAHRMRAAAARQGLWGNPGYEAAFFQVWLDADGKQLNGAHRYEWTLPEAPPAKAFWSITMYDVPKFYVVNNAINRYGISSITQALKYNADGSLTIYIQRDNPGPDKQSNWLPAPTGDFRPALSIFEPQDAALDAAYTLPAIRRVD